MSKLFGIQLIVSFVIGGGVITLLSLVAEKANRRIAGIILAFPTTIALSFFFLGWTLTAETVAHIVPATLIPLGLCVLFVPMYAYVAEYSARVIKSKVWQIVVSFMVSIGAWFALGAPLIIFEINNLAVGVGGYGLLIFIAHRLLQRKNYDKPVTLTYTLGQKIGRATFVGFIILLVVLLGKVLNPFWGGMFAMFPAVFSSLLMILHWYYGPKSLFPIIQKVALGSLSLFSYAITAMVVFPIYGFVIGTLISYVVSLIVTLLLMRFQQPKKN